MALMLALAKRSAVRWSAAAAVILIVTVGFITFARIITQPSSPPNAPPRAGGGPAITRVCGQPILRSPYTYDGAAGPYRSGTPGLPTYGTPDSDFPAAEAGMVLPPGAKDYPSFQLRPGVVYYLEPGIHIGSIQANKNDAFVGGFSRGKATIVSGAYASSHQQAIDSNPSYGNQPGVIIKYLTIEKFTPAVDHSAINQEANTNWTIQYNTVAFNVPGAGILAGANNTIGRNCLTQNGQYGFQSTDVVGFSSDSITGGPYNVTIEGNEISRNDTCDLEGRVDNRAVGLRNYNPVPVRYRNVNCGNVMGDGNQGGFKLWRTDGVTIKDNYIHHNWGPGGWADTDNANTTWTGNNITDNDGPAIIEETSYNFSITYNNIARNGILAGLGNPNFPSPAIYVSESGSDRMFGSVPPCPEASCAGQNAYSRQSVISSNTFLDNGGSVFLWQNSNRYCGDSFDPACTLAGGHSRPFTVSACRANLPSSAVDTATYVGNHTGSPQANWFDGCMWKTENVNVTHNRIDFDPAHIRDCSQKVWPACGAGGIFSEYGGPGRAAGWVIPTDITFFQGNHWSQNVYIGPSTFYAWNQGNGDNPVSWAEWTGRISDGNMCGSPGERETGYCSGPFGQDTGSIYQQ
jgi:Right handed beta helix region